MATNFEQGVEQILQAIGDEETGIVSTSKFCALICAVMPDCSEEMEEHAMKQRAGEAG